MGLVWLCLAAYVVTELVSWVLLGTLDEDETDDCPTADAPPRPLPRPTQ